MTSRTARWTRLVLAGLALSACAAASAVELRGFRGVPWGADADSLGAADLVSAQGPVRCYRREQENLLYGDSPLSEVRFCFHQDRLFMVVVDARVDQKTLMAEFQASYGRPGMFAPSWAAWGNQATRARVEIVGLGDGTRASMRMYSNEYEPREKFARHSGF